MIAELMNRTTPLPEQKVRRGTVDPCLVKMAAVTLLAGAATYTGTTLAQPAPAAAPPSYTCPTGGPITVKADGCAYLKDLNAAFPGMVPAAAYVNAPTICFGLRSTPPDKYAAAWQQSHPAFSISQAEEYIKITQADAPSGCYW